MIYRAERALRWARRLFSRSEWAIRWLGLAATEEPSTAPGLVMIQIDGLSYTQFKRALATGRLPFLRSLIDRDHYVDRAFYSGLPSSTPAVQGELFYGVKGAVPAFSFRMQANGEVVRMWEPATADAVERRLAGRGKGLLAGGSSYSNIYAGGALEAHFCPSRLGWGDLLHGANPLAVAILGLANAYSLVRAFALLAVESALAAIDFVKGLISGNDLVRELRFVPTRVGICVLLRELVTIGAKIDVARGLPIVHLNLLGYDEQAHRRGPGSAFAHWALKGIDDAVARIWRAARRSKRRDYDVWVYSDHGQESCRSYADITGRSLEAAIAALLSGRSDRQSSGGTWPYGVQSHRIRMLSGNERWQRWLPTYGSTPAEADTPAEVAAMGPIAHLYLRQPLAREDVESLAQELTAAESVPLALAASVAGKADTWTDEGRFTMPDDASAILGAEHPHLAEVAADLVALAHHPDAGDLVLCGWRAGAGPVSFAVENGAHGGPGPEETNGFALLPDDAPLLSQAPSLRPFDLRQAALRHLGRLAPAVPTAVPEEQSDDDVLRVMSYNVHSCIGMDGRLSPERIARVIAQNRPHVVALQELDVGRARTDEVDQAHEIAHRLEMEFHFHPSLRIEEELYGDAVLSRLPLRLVKAAGLPRLAPLEPRGALWVEIATPGGPLQFVNTHLGLTRRERKLQTDALMGPGWLGNTDADGPWVLAGDLNALPHSRTCRRLGERLRDAQLAVDDHRPQATFFARRPTARIDHIFVDPRVEVVSARVPSAFLAKVASDHLPLIVDIRLPATDRLSATVPSLSRAAIVG